MEQFLNPKLSLGARIEAKEAEIFSTQKAQRMVIPFARFLRKKMSGIFRRIPCPNENFGLKQLCLVTFLSVLSCALPALLFADAEVDDTLGPGSYQDSLLNLDANVSKEVNLGAGYDQMTSSITSMEQTKTYTGSLTIKSVKHFTFGLSLSEAPEANDAKSSGWGLNAAYSSAKPEEPEEQPKTEIDESGKQDNASDDADENSGDAPDEQKDDDAENFTWGCSLGYNINDLSEYIDYNTYLKRLNKKGKTKFVAVDHSDWYSLKQTLVNPGLTFSLFQLVDISFGYSKYSYDRDVSIFSARLAKLSVTRAQNVTFGNTTSTIDGFPDTISSAGIAVSPLDSLKLEYDWSITDYVLDIPAVTSSTLTVFYNFCPALQMKAAYNILSDQTAYTTVGLKWMWD